METASTRLGEEEGEMERERKGMEDSINMRYAAGLGVMADARDECLAALLGDEEFKRLEQRVGKKAGAGFFEHTTMEDSPESTLNFHRGYMGKVVPKGQKAEPAGSNTSHNAEDGIADTKTTLETVTDADHHQTTSAKEFADFQNEVKIKLGELSFPVIPYGTSFGISG
nr:hypothetical protein BaRGS_024204 [Batillaria attramentaria]